MVKDNKSDWRVVRLNQIRKLIMQAAPDITEEQKYKMPSNPDGIPVWYHQGMITTGETHKKHLRLTFAKGAKLRLDHDPKKLINSRSAMTITEEDKIDEDAFIQLVKSAIKLNKDQKKK